MDQATIQRVRSNPYFQELTRKRAVFSWSLTILMLLIYFTYIFLVAFAPGFLAQPVAAGAVTSLALPLGIGVILSAIILTGIYVWRANGEFDRLTLLVRKDAER
jgi:uncharacterized membrane protein (DUF485 family)